MTFDEWWDSLTTRQQAQIPNETAKEVWVAATESENEACAKLCESHYNHEAKDCAEEIRERMKA